MNKKYTEEQIAYASKPILTMVLVSLSEAGPEDETGISRRGSHICTASQE